jgi:hypothetical protein
VLLLMIDLCTLHFDMGVKATTTDKVVLDLCTQESALDAKGTGTVNVVIC